MDIKLDQPIKRMEGQAEPLLAVRRLRTGAVGHVFRPDAGPSETAGSRRSNSSRHRLEVTQLSVFGCDVM